jgi:hypothetical protein
MEFKKSLQKEVIGMKEAAAGKMKVPTPNVKKPKIEDILMALQGDLASMLKPEIQTPIVRNDPERIKSKVTPIEGIPKNARKESAITAPGQLAPQTKESSAITYFKNIVEDNPGLGGVLTPNYAGQEKDLELYYKSLAKAPDIDFLPKRDPLDPKNKTIEGDKKDVPKEVQKTVSGAKPFSHTSLLQSLNIF